MIEDAILRLKSVRFNCLNMIQVTDENLIWINKYKYSLGKVEGNRCENYALFGGSPDKEGSLDDDEMY